MLAAAMLHDVLDAARAAGLAGVAAVLAGASVTTSGVTVLPDPGSGLIAAARAGIRAAVAAGAGTVVVLPGDIPLVRPEDIAALATVRGPRAVVVVPDRHGAGTNALVLHPPDAIEPAFGPRSAARHLRAARAAGILPQRVIDERLGLDVDTPDDLAELARRRPGGRMRVVLDRLRVAGAATAVQRERADPGGRRAPA